MITTTELAERLRAIERMGAPEPYLDYWRRTQVGSCCVQHIITVLGCDDSCVRAGADDWYWHGTQGEFPNPESLTRFIVETSEGITTYCECGQGWFTCVHARKYIHYRHGAR